MLLIPLSQPLFDLSNLIFVCSLDELRLCTDVQNSVTIPMMTSSRNQVLVTTQSLLIGIIVTMIAHIPPHIAATID